MSIKDSNILIADFMGWEKYEGYNYVTPHYQNYLSVGNGLEQTNIFMDDYLKFHKSWDWIICAAEKCKNIYLENIDNTSIINHWESVESGLLSLDIRHVYAAVIEFINNQNKK